MALDVLSRIRNLLRYIRKFVRDTEFAERR